MENKYPMNQRRVRANNHIRELASTVVLDYKKFIQPLFVNQALFERKAVPGMGDIWSDTITSVKETIKSDMKNGVTKFLLFPVPKDKYDHDFNFDFAVKVVKEIKAEFKSNILLACDLCLCSYTSHGHCGILSHDHTRLLNDPTVTLLSDYALKLARAGADCIAPSDMTDGRIRAIRQILDNYELDHVSIMSYSSKFSSQYYGPFRDVCDSAPNSQGLQNRKTYQISPQNFHDAIESSIRDADEGADMLMVKPAALYTDVISAIKQNTNKPIAAYHVSGEYASIELMANAGLLDKEKGHIETWTALVRSGADIIISYASRHAKEWIGRMEV
jgi:porphobilinogen synthase